MQQRVEHALCSCCTSTIAGIVKHIESRAHKSETVSSVIIADILEGLKRAGIVKSNGRTWLRYLRYNPNPINIGFIADEPIVNIFDLLRSKAASSQTSIFEIPAMQQRVEHALCSCCIKHIESRTHRSETVSYNCFIADEPTISATDLLPGIIKSNGRKYPFYTNIDDYNEIIRKDIAHKLYIINCGDLIIKRFGRSNRFGRRRNSYNQELMRYINDIRNTMEILSNLK